MTALLHNLRYAMRVLRKSPGFTLVAVLSLTLGIGANTAVFSVIQAVLLRPLPYPHPQRLLRVGQPEGLEAISLFQFQFWRDNGSMFASAAGFTGGGDVSLTSA
ncbi:MAG: hypothetical protein ACLQU1_25000 [Bryobacteraceae bacterium]